jgi:O-succinylbenzoate synthase
MRTSWSAVTADLAHVELLRVRLPLVRPFTTSFGTMSEKEALLVRAVGGDGAEGWGECAAAQEPRYSAEWNDGAWAVLRDFLVPAALAGKDAGIRGHPMARAALETALLDLDLRRAGVSMARHLGGTRDRVPCGVSLGIEDRVEDLLEQVAAFVQAGYRRVKLKIEPGRDVDVVRRVRQSHPDTPLSADANAAYGPEDAAHLAALDELGLEYLEQPLAEDRLLGHADLQARLRTPICLDETITSAAVAGEAIRLDACRVINIKQGRVGGPAEARAIHDAAEAENVPVWCGGMLETGVGRAANLALASLPNFRLPGDTSASARYFPFDVTEPFVVDADGTMAVPSGPGLGVTPIPDVLTRVTAERTTVRLP